MSDNPAESDPVTMFLILCAAAFMVGMMYLYSAPGQAQADPAPVARRRAAKKTRNTASQTTAKASKEEVVEDAADAPIDACRKDAFQAGQKWGRKSEWKDRKVEDGFVRIFGEGKIPVTKRAFLDDMQDAFNQGVEFYLKNEEFREEERKRQREEEGKLQQSSAVQTGNINATPSSQNSGGQAAPVVVLSATQKRQRRVRQTLDSLDREMSRNVAIAWEQHKAPHPRAGCVKFGPAFEVPKDLEQDIFNALQALEGTVFGGSGCQLHVVVAGKRPPGLYDVTLQRKYRQDNPKTQLIMHISSSG